jgi:hypothetical protein
MREAFNLGDMNSLRILTDKVAAREPELAAAVRQLVDNYAYDALESLFATEENHGASY